MSYPWSLIRGSSVNPSSLKFSSLINKENIAENELFKPERAQPQAISAHTEDLVLLQDPFLFTKLRQNSQKFYGPFEPDGDKLRLWCKFNHIGSVIKDYSFTFKNDPSLLGGIFAHGNPKLCAGPDDGVKGGTIVTRFNSDDNYIDYYSILNPDEGLLGVGEITTGFSMYIKFMVEGPITQHNGVDPTLWFHVDDVNGDNGTWIKIGTNGELKFIVRDTTTTRSFVSPNNKITSGVWNVACLTYNLTGNVLGMRIANQTQTDSGDDNPTFPASHDNSVFFAIGPNQDSGKFVGRIADIRWYRDLLFSSGQMDNIWNNGRSISPIEYGALSVAGHAKFNQSVYSAGFDSTGFDSTGFDTV